MKTTVFTKRTLVKASLIIGLLLPTLSYAGGNKYTSFNTKFINNSHTQVNAKVFNGSTEVYNKNINPNKDHTFTIGWNGCKKDKTRSFKVYENQTGELIGSGSFFMDAGYYRSSNKYDECWDEEYKFNSCDDASINDNFSVSCSYKRDNRDRKNRAGRVTID